MKYMIMMFGGFGATLETRTPEWITSMHEFMLKLDSELKEGGEVVASHGLVDPSQAKTVRFQGGVPVPTDGPFAEVKESLAGYWRSRPGWSRSSSTPWRSGRSWTSRRSCDQSE